MIINPTETEDDKLQKVNISLLLFSNEETVLQDVLVILK